MTTGPMVARLFNDYIAEQTAGVSRTLWPGCAYCLSTTRRRPARSWIGAVHDLDMRGVLLYANLDGRHPDEAGVRVALFGRAEELSIPLVPAPSLSGDHRPGGWAGTSPAR